jgi:hypothetical protein
MSFMFKATASKAALAVGMYPGALVGIEEFESAYGPALKWHFVALVGDDELPITSVTSQKFSEQSNARKYAEAILQCTFRHGEELDPAQLLSEPCLLVVAVKELDNGSTVNRIERVLPKPKPDDDDVPF